MEQNGVILRGGDPVDRRVVRVKLTELGRSYRSSCDQAMKELADILYDQIPPDELEMFLSVLRRIFENISHQEDLLGSD